MNIEIYKTYVNTLTDLTDLRNKLSAFAIVINLYLLSNHRYYYVTLAIAIMINCVFWYYMGYLKHLHESKLFVIKEMETSRSDPRSTNAESGSASVTSGRVAPFNTEWNCTRTLRNWSVNLDMHMVMLFGAFDLILMVSKYAHRF